jgi:hypothetical protein
MTGKRRRLTPPGLLAPSAPNRGGEKGSEGHIEPRELEYRGVLVALTASSEFAACPTGSYVPYNQGWSSPMVGSGGRREIVDRIRARNSIGSPDAELEYRGLCGRTR